MWWHNLKISLRGIVRDKGYSLFNILGLAVALACSFLFVFWIKFELSYERSYTKYDRIYRLMDLEERTSGPFHTLSLPYGVEGIKDQFPQIEYVTGVAISNGVSFREYGKDDSEALSMRALTASLDFLRMFSYEYVEGSPVNVARNKGIVISEDAAHRLFGEEPALGKLITAGGSPMVIDAVVKVPKNTELQFDVLPMGMTSARLSGIIFMMLREGETMTPELKDLIGEYVKSVPRDRVYLDEAMESNNILVAQPLRDTHFRSPDGLMMNMNTIYDGAGDLGQLYLFSVVALLILIIAIINYVNTSIARSMTRMKEVGVRKVTGSQKKDLVVRFLFESFLITLLGVILSLVLVKAFFPNFSELMGNTISLALDGATFGIAAVVCVVVAILSGAYAAFYLSSLPPSIVFRGGRSSHYKDRLRKVLLGVQFFLAVGILICTSIVYKQVNTILNGKNGMDRENVFQIPIPAYDPQSFINVIMNENPDIVSATSALAPPYQINRGYSGVSWEGSTEESQNMSFGQVYCDYHYKDVWGLEVVDGEFIPIYPEGATTDTYLNEHGAREVVINQTFAKLMGVDDPVGRFIQAEGGRRIIVGVVKDFNFKPLTEPIMPLLISWEPRAMFMFYVRTNGRDNEATMQWVLDKYNEMNPGPRPLTSYTSIADEYRTLHDTELRTRTIMAILSAIALFLSLLGVVSMVSFMLEKRTKEIAMRKINGASAGDIIRLFGVDILRVCLIASIIAFPICYYVMSRWLETYVFRTAPSWWIFVLVSLVVMAVTLAIIAVQVYIVARRNPVESLRSE